MFKLQTLHFFCSFVSESSDIAKTLHANMLATSCARFLRIVCPAKLSLSGIRRPQETRNLASEKTHLNVSNTTVWRDREGRGSLLASLADFFPPSSPLESVRGLVETMSGIITIKISGNSFSESKHL